MTMVKAKEKPNPLSAFGHSGTLVKCKRWDHIGIVTDIHIGCPESEE